MSKFLTLVSVLASVVRWGEPWDVEQDDDPLLAPAGGDESPIW
jgi:hypothetical protein